jgi:Ni/Co efflux regulator RcnB
MRVSCQSSSSGGAARAAQWPGGLADRIVQDGFMRPSGDSFDTTDPVFEPSVQSGVTTMNRFTKAAVVGLALATTAAPLAAEAQSRNQHRREHRQERRDDRREWRQDNRNDRREWRQDNRNDRREWRQDDRRDRHWDRNDRNWWRGRDDFRDYRGARRGYWYAPSYGYYRVEPRYYGYRWTRGAYLPPAYRGYYVRDPYVYGLRPAPRGYRYVYAGDDIVMIAIATGLIASVISNVF